MNRILIFAKMYISFVFINIHFTTDDKNADFWKKFFEEKELYLPKGENTIKVSGEFSLSQDVVNSKVHISNEIKIKVVNDVYIREVPNNHHR